MKLKTTQLRDAITVALVVGSTAFIGMGAAFAQDETPASGDQEAKTLDSVRVTGSRIPKVEIETSQPIAVVSRQQIQAQGFTSVNDILQNLTSSGSPAIARSDVLASGENVGGYYVDIRNLGAQRTLVLVNGKRIGATTDGLQDLSQIPIAAIEKIEILKDGASSTYGSDAIAAVVNIFTRQNFNGAEANVFLGNFDQGDGFEQAYDFTIGSSNDKSSLLLSMEYTKEDPRWAKDQRISKFGSNGPNYPGQGWSPISQNGAWVGGPCAPANPRNPPLCTLTPGTDSRNPANYTVLQPSQYANSNEQMMFETGIERRSIFLSGTYDISDSIRFRTDITYNNRNTKSQIAGYPYRGTLSGDSYYSPTPGQALSFYRRLWEVPRTTESELSTYRIAAGFEGMFDIGDKQWVWDIGANLNRNKVTKRGHGDGSLLALRLAHGPSWFNSSTGRVECGSAANPIPYGSGYGNGECIPFNPLLPYGDIQDGSLANPALQDFLFPTFHDVGTTRSTSYTANIAGSLFSLPAGDVGLALGVEHREESGEFIPDAFAQAALHTGLPANTTRGKYSLNEVYGELEIPILKEVPFAHELTLALASRYSDYSNFGDTTNSKVSLTWRPIDSLLTRATFAQGFRAPPIGNLYGGLSGSFESYTDPCSVGVPGSVAGSPACTNAGVPADYVQLGQGLIPCTAWPCQTNDQFFSGSNPDLKPEESESWTAGIVWSPKWAEGLTVNLDWYKYTITSVISDDSVAMILRDCYINNISSRCESVVRGPLGNITSMSYGKANLGEVRTQGYDFGVNYRLPEFSAGQFAIDWQTSYTSQYDVLVDLAPETKFVGNVGWAGGSTIFRLRSNLGLSWNKGDWGVNYTARYYSGLKESCVASKPCTDPDALDVYGDSNPTRRVGSNTFHDLQVSVKLPWNGKAAIGANNITDHAGPVMFTAPSSQWPTYGGFDYGRFFYVRYQQKF